MIKTFKLFEQLEDDIQFKSNKTWYNNHSKIYTEEEEKEIILAILREINKFKTRDVVQSVSVVSEQDPYGEEDWSDSNMLPMSPMDIKIRDAFSKKIISILQERLELLRSFKNNK